MSNSVRWSPEYLEAYQRRALLEKRQAGLVAKDEHTNFLVRLPYPPTVNLSHEANGDGSYRLSDKARAFRENASAIAQFEFEKQGYTTLNGKVRVLLTLVPPDARKRDIDNPIKQILDALQAARIFVDDCQVKQLEVTMMDPMLPGEGATQVTVKTL